MRKKARAATRIAPGVIVIDVGTNGLPDGRLAGNVATSACGRAASITPVPSGMVPMTIAWLLENTFLTAEARRGLCPVDPHQADDRIRSSWTGHIEGKRGA